MEVKIDGDEIVVIGNTEIVEPYLEEVEGAQEFRGYWHFIRDFAQLHKFEMTPELRSGIQGKVSDVVAVRNRMNLELTTEEKELAWSFLSEGYRQYDYQIKAANFIVRQKAVLLADDVGLGKTIVGITAILTLIEKYDIRKIFIVVPASLRLQWLSECRKFINRKMFPDIELVVNNKTSEERKFQYRNFEKTDNPVIMISSYDALRNDREQIMKLSVGAVVLDEAAKIKSRSTKTNKAVRKLFGRVPYRLAMTATPIENGLEDLFSIMEFVDKRRFASKAYFERQYCVMERFTIWRPRRIDLFKVVGYKNTKDAKEKLAGVYIRRTLDDVSVELPDVIKTNISVALTEEQRNLYQRVTGEIYDELSREDILGKFTILQEICDGSELIDAALRSSSKTEEIKRLLNEDLRYSKVIIFTRFKKYAEILMRELEGCNPLLITGDVSQEEREYIRKKFNTDEKSRVLIGTEAIQEGLNLQVASVLINVELPWNPAKLQQRLGRLRRLGSEHDTIRMINLIAENTIEGHVVEVLYEKGRLFEKMFKRDEDVKIRSLLDMTPKELITVVTESGNGEGTGNDGISGTDEG